MSNSRWRLSTGGYRYRESPDPEYATIVTSRWVNSRRRDGHELILRPTVHPGRSRLRLRRAEPPGGVADTFTSRYIDTGKLRLHAVVGGDGYWVAEQAPEEMLAALTEFLAPYRGGESAAHETRERSAHT
jgi:hypothetical protein